MVWLPPSNVRSGSNSRRTARSCNCLAFVGYTLEEIAAKPAATLAAVGRVMAIAELALDGTILRANENLLKAFRYAQDELVGRHTR
jgi:hypothetical protein